MSHRAETKRKRAAFEQPETWPNQSWTVQMEEWKVSALGRVRRQLEHVCSGPSSRPKSFCITEAVHNVVAQDYNPESQPGLSLRDLLTETIAGQIARRADLLPQLQMYVPASEDREFMLRYLNSSWWVDTFLQLEQVSCQDVLQAVDTAISEAMEEQLRVAAA